MTERTIAIEAAYRTQLPWIQRRLTLLIGDAEEARDLTHQTFERALRRWSGELPDELARWLTTVAMRLGVDELRRRRRWGWLGLHESDASWAIRVDPDLWRAIAALDPGPRATILLTTLDGCTQEEVAQVLGVKRGTVGSWSSRAKAQLRRTLEDADDEPTDV